MDYGSFIDHLYYKKLPEIYRIEDLKQTPSTPLYRYLKSLGEGGFKEVISDIEGLYNLIDPSKCPDAILPFFMESFGLSYYEDIDPVYQRKLVSNIGELVKRRGTYSCVRYLARALTGMTVDMDRLQEENNVTLNVYLEAETADQVANLDVGVLVLEKYLKYWVPFWLNVKVMPKLKTQFIESTSYTTGAVSHSNSYKIIPGGAL